MYSIQLKRSYDEIGDQDGFRVLVDRLWPRGIKKESLKHDWWPKFISPSTGIRKAFNHEEEKFATFKEEYILELNRNERKEEYLEKIATQLEKQPVTLLYGAKDQKYNHAVVLKQWTEQRLI